MAGPLPVAYLPASKEVVVVSDQGDLGRMSIPGTNLTARLLWGIFQRDSLRVERPLRHNKYSGNRL
jgi:hypothetical protein